MIKVSVILTTYNSESQLQEVLDSITTQQGIGEFFELELIVIDDCSTDNTTNILKLNNIPYFKTDHNSGGPNKGRNIGLTKSSGDFICIADHDDIWFNNKISILLSASHLAPIISSGYELSDSTSSRLVRASSLDSGKKFKQYPKNKTFITKLTKSKFGQQTYLGSILFSSNFKHILFEEEYGMSDFDWVLRIFYNQKSVEYCGPLYLRKVKSDNLSLDEKYRINDYIYSLKSISLYKNNFSRFVAISRKRINGSMGRYYYLIGNMKLARKYFFKSTFEIKTILYIITTFVGSNLVKKYFRIFG